MTANPIDTPPLRLDVHERIRECFCKECGRVAPSWFHRDFLLGHDGFTCIWCAFPPEHCKKIGIDPPEPPDPALYRADRS